MKRKERKREVVGAAWREFQAFKKVSLTKSKAGLWEESGRIHFYRTVMEYFQYHGSERPKCWEILEGLSLPIQAMWNCYLTYEGLEYGTWRGIEGILEQMEARAQGSGRV